MRCGRHAPILEAKAVRGVGRLAGDQGIAAVDILHEDGDLLLRGGKASAQALEQLHAAGVALQGLLELKVAGL